MTVSTTTNSVSAEVDELRHRFFDKLNREGAPTPDGFHPYDLERIQNNTNFVHNFLEHHDMNVANALKMLWDTCHWRQTYGTNEISEKNLNMEYVKSGIYFPRGRDIDGKRLLVARLRLHIRGLRDLDELLRVFVYWLERLWRESNFDKFTMVFEMANCGLSNVDLGYTRTVVNVFKSYYPNTVNYMLIYDLPWVLNGPMKIIRSFMPPKMVAAMRNVNAKSLSEYIPKDNQLLSWGGPDTYEFEFVPEVREELAARVEQNGSINSLPDTPSKITSTNSNETDAPMSDRKVHFANDGGIMSSDTSMSNGVEGIMLRLNPVEAIHFVKSGHDMVGTVEITNIHQVPITYKIKTTSPDKFRVRPSSGVLAPGASSSINVVLMHGSNTLATLGKDKFLVMCMELAPDAGTGAQDITELWKNTPSGFPQVEQHRLKCLPADAAFAAEMSRSNGAAGQLNGFEFGGRSPARHLESTVAQLAETTSRLEAQIKFSQTLQWISMLVFLCLAVGIVYILKTEINSSTADYCVKRH